MSEPCDEYGGLLLWFSDDAEIAWLGDVLQAYSVDCVHLGKDTCTPTDNVTLSHGYMYSNHTMMISLFHMMTYTIFQMTTTAPPM